MIRKLHLHHFRCFDDIVIAGLESVTLLGGRNNAGKSAILEALYLLYGCQDAQTFLALASMRNRGRGSQSPKQLWMPLFNDFNTDEKIHIEAFDSDDKKISLSVTAVRQIETVIARNGIAKHNGTFRRGDYSQALMMTLQDGEQNWKTLYSIVPDALGHDNTITSSSAEVITMRPVILYSNGMNFDGAVLAEWVGKILLNKQKDVLLDLLHRFDKGIVDVMTILEDSVPYIYVIFEDGRKISIDYMGDGLNKALLLFLCIQMYPGGIVLIDELENGFHYSLYEQLLPIFYKAAMDAHCQLIITTHSSDIINASADAMQYLGCIEQLAYQRMDLSDNHRQAYTFTGQQLLQAAIADVEVR